jgi:hypothetical protein
MPAFYQGRLGDRYIGKALKKGDDVCCSQESFAMIRGRKVEMTVPTPVNISVKTAEISATRVS